jgi:hypothetical protein
MNYKNYELETGEKIAIAIRYAMQDDMTYFRSCMEYLRFELHWDDNQIGTAFMEIGAIMFNEDLENELEQLENEDN